MDCERRGFLAPRDLFDRLLYLGIALIMPYCLWAVPKAKNELFLAVGVGWWFICTFHTLEWMRSWSFLKKENDAPSDRS